MSDLKWNSEQIVNFLGIYKQYTCLWDVSSEDYLKRDKRQAAMQKLVTDLEQEGFGNIDIAKLKTKIKSIKDSYRFELNKVKSSMKSGAGTEDIYKPRLAWFAAADCFWKKVVLGRESTSNLDKPLIPKQTTTPSGTLQEKDVSPEPCSSGSVMKASTPQKELNTHSTLKMRPQPRKTLHKLKSPTKNKFKKSMKLTRFEANINKLETIATLTATDPDDEYEKYGRHIAAQLRAMPLRSFILLQQDINNLITTERLNLIDSAATSSYFTTQMQRPNSASTHSSMSFEPIATNTSNTDTQCELHDECDDLLNKSLIDICSPASNETM